jgi:hypothetical protein
MPLISRTQFQRSPRIFWPIIPPHPSERTARFPRGRFGWARTEAGSKPRALVSCHEMSEGAMSHQFEVGQT